VSTASRILGVVALAGFVLSSVSGATADTLARRPNINDLIRQAEIILHGDVIAVTDGIENNVPFTEVTVKVRETIRGTATATYTFRQFGLLKPRRLENGLVSYNVRPTEWAAYEPNEEVLLFLYKAAKRTGLRTTAGLGQGKFTIEAGRAVSQQQNVGLFDGVRVDTGTLKRGDAELLASRRGSVSAAALLSFVRRAVGEQWIERGRMTDAR
jgi:hypothetical protein